jgi:DNA-binding FadR family transcriptional regulator
MSSVASPRAIDAPSRSARPPRPNVADEIVEGQRRDIADGPLAGGSRLPSECELARHFGVSRLTIREATRALVAMAP